MFSSSWIRFAACGRTRTAGSSRARTSWWRGTSCAATLGCPVCEARVRGARRGRGLRGWPRDVSRIVPCASNYPRHPAAGHESPRASAPPHCSDSPSAGGIVVLAGEWSAAANEIARDGRGLQLLALELRAAGSRVGGALSLARIADVLPLAAGCGAGSRSTRRTRRPRSSLAPRARSRRADDSSRPPRRAYPTRSRSSRATTNSGWRRRRRRARLPRCRSAVRRWRQAPPRAPRPCTQRRSARDNFRSIDAALHLERRRELAALDGEVVLEQHDLLRLLEVRETCRARRSPRFSIFARARADRRSDRGDPSTGCSCTSPTCSS